MPVFDAPINTDDNNVERVLKQNLPLLLYLYDRSNLHLDSALKQQAEKLAGELLIVRVDAKSNPQTYIQYKRPKLPALFAIKDHVVQSTVEDLKSSSDIAAHIAYLLGKGPKPELPQKAPASDGDHPITVTDGSFQNDVLQSSVPVLVDFWAPWCGPCHMIAPTVEEMAKKYAGRIKVAKLNVDQNPQTAVTYQTLSIPTLIMFKQGQVLHRVVGAQPPQAIERLIQSAL